MDNSPQLLAQATQPGPAGSRAAGAPGIRNPFLPPNLGSGTMDQGLTNAGTIIRGLVSLFLVIAVIATLFYFILGALGWVTSDGEKGKLETARNKITNAILGLIIVAAAWAVWILIGKFIGVDVTHLPFPTITGQ